MQISTRAQSVLHHAEHEAVRFGSQNIEIEHVTLGLFKIPRIFSIFIDGAVNIETITSKIEKGLIPKEHKKILKNHSPMVQHILSLSEEEATEKEAAQIDCDHILLAISKFEAEPGHKKITLGLKYEELVEMIRTHDENCAVRYTERLAEIEQEKAANLAKVRAQIEKHESPEGRAAFNQVCGALSDYLCFMGWTQSKDFSGWIDPLTGETCITDQAFTKETDRYNYLTLEKKLLPKPKKS